MKSDDNGKGLFTGKKDMWKRIHWRIIILKYMSELLPVVIALLGSFVVGGILIIISKNNPLLAYGKIIESSFGSIYAISSTLARALPITISGIAAGWAFKAGLFNIGCEGQLVLGGLSAIIVALFVPLPSGLLLVLAIAAAMLVGGFWALISGWLHTGIKVPILISSLLMNFLALGLVSFIINFILLEPGGARSQTAMLEESVRLSRLVKGTSLSAGVFIVIALIIITTFILRRTSYGYELRIFGINPEFAIASGVNPVKMTLITMLVSGAIAGVVGFIQVFGVHYRLIDGALNGPGYAWTGVMAAILANNNPIGIMIASLFLAGVQTGASGMERAISVPSEISFVVQAVLILLIASRNAFKGKNRKDSI